jgi:hypothetical protein
LIIHLFIAENHSLKLKAKTGMPPKVVDAWKDQPDLDDHPEFDWIISKIQDFQRRGMTGQSIAYS